MKSKLKTSKVLDIILWAIQAMVALVFLMGASTVLIQSVETLADKMSFVKYYPVWAVKLIAFSELLGAIGLILPAALRIKPILTPLAAFCLTVVMILAVIYHFNHNEAAGAGFPAILGLLSLFIAWGRLKKLPITAEVITKPKSMTII